MNMQATRFSDEGFDRQPLLSPGIDSGILLVYALLCGIGLIMVTSASIGVADHDLGDPFYYGKRQFLRLLMAFMLLWLAWRIPTRFWQEHGMKLMLASILSLVLVLVPGLGHTVNGATRWINLGVFTVQVSEIAKLLLVIYLSGYLIRRSDQIGGSMGFIKPMVILALAAGLLLLEPDFGAAVVILTTGLGMMFLGGVRFGHFFVFLFGTLSIMTIMVLITPYRLVRVTSFLDPWADPFETGFQLVQSLIAVGGGGMFGRGLGGSIQKLSYLPEAHTDFLFAIYAEEFGLAGIVVLIGLFVWFARRCFVIARDSMQLEKPFGAYLVYGIGLLICIQALINIGVNMGALPTKGLTLPFISYGGNSILVMSFAVGIVLRVHYENHQQSTEKSPSRKKRRDRS